MHLKESLTKNLGVKIIALVVAMFIWFNASGHKEVIWLKTVPIALENLPDSLGGSRYYTPSDQGYEKKIIARLKTWWQDFGKPPEAREKRED